MHIVLRNILYEVSFENNFEQFLSYEVRLKLYNDTDTNAKGFLCLIFLQFNCCSQNRKLLNLSLIRQFCRQLFENIVTKEEIAQNVHFLLLPQCFPPFCHRLSIQLWRFSNILQNMFKVVCCRIVV